MSLGRSFGSVAATYDRVRPAYPAAYLDRAQDVLALDADACVLDLGAGTGRLSVALAERFERVIAVEPDDAMRALIPETVEVIAGAAEAIPVGAATVDAVFVGEAFHWFDAALAVREVARVLRPRGGVAIITDHWWETEPPLPPAALELLAVPYRRSLGERNPPWDDAFTGSPFEPLRFERFESAITLDADELLELYSTTSSIALLADAEREALLRQVRTHLTGPYRLPIRHELASTRLRAGS